MSLENERCPLCGHDPRVITPHEAQLQKQVDAMGKVLNVAQALIFYLKEIRASGETGHADFQPLADALAACGEVSQ